MSTHKIPGPPIVGMCDLFVGGAGSPKRPVVVVTPKAPAKPSHDLQWKQSPQKNRTYVALVPTQGKTHEESIQKARATAQHAAQVANTVAKAATAATLQAHRKVAVGAARPQVARNTHLVAVQLAQQARDLGARAKQLSGHADQHQKLVTTGKKKLQVAATQAKKIYGPSGKPGVRVQVGGGTGRLDPAIGAALRHYYTAVGALPDPQQPGLLTDGSLDPMILVGDDVVPGSSGGSAQPGGDPTAASTGDPSADGTGDLAASAAADPTYGLGPPPTSAPPLVAGQDYEPDNYPPDMVFNLQGDLPPGTILYQPALKPLPWQGIGSYTRFFPNTTDRSDGHGPSGFQWGGGNPGIMDGWYWWWHGAQAGTEYKHENAGNALDDGYGAGTQTMQDRATESVKRGWGPLIGNPSGWTAGLRYDMGGDRWFWFYDKAPDWARSSDPNVGDFVRLAKAILDYQTQVTAAKADALQQQAQDKLDAQNAAALAKQQAQQAAQQAVQDAQQQQQQQTAEGAAASQAKIAKLQQDTQANAILLQQAQQELQQGGGGAEQDGGGDGGAEQDGNGQDGGGDGGAEQDGGGDGGAEQDGNGQDGGGDGGAEQDGNGQDDGADDGGQDDGGP